MSELSKLTNTANPFDAWFAPVEVLNGLSMMDHLYNRLDGAYPHKWRSNFPNLDAIDNWKTSWAEAFEEEGIKPADIKAGLKACRTRFDWPPSCAEFLKACKPNVDVDPMRAYYEAVAGVQERLIGKMGTWSHPAIYWAAMPLSFDLGNQSFSQIKGRWEHALFEQLDKKEWPLIPQPMVALPEPGKAMLSKEKAAQMLEELGATTIIKATSDKTDYKKWAKNIMSRIERKGHNVPDWIIKDAKKALGKPA